MWSESELPAHGSHPGLQNRRGPSRNHKQLNKGIIEGVIGWLASQHQTGRRGPRSRIKLADEAPTIECTVPYPARRTAPTVTSLIPELLALAPLEVPQILGQFVLSRSGRSKVYLRAVFGSR